MPRHLVVTAGRMAILTFFTTKPPIECTTKMIGNFMTLVEPKKRETLRVYPP